MAGAGRVRYKRGGKSHQCRDDGGVIEEGYVGGRLVHIVAWNAMGKRYVVASYRRFGQWCVRDT